MAKGRPADKAGPATKGGKSGPKAMTPAPLVKMAGGHTKAITALAFAPDAQTLVSGSDDTTVRLWDTGTGKPCECGVLTAARWGIAEVAFSPDGRTVAAVSRGVNQPVKGHTRAFVWDLIKRKSVELEATEGNTFPFRSPTFAPGDVVALRYKGVRLYRATTGKHICDLPVSNKGDRIAFTPDGSRLLFGDWEGALHDWDVGRGKELRAMSGHTDYVTCLAFSSDGRRLTSAASSFDQPWPPRQEERSIRLWDVKAGKERRRWTGEWDTTTYLAFLPGGEGFVSFHDPQHAPVVRLWAVDADKPLASWSPKGGMVRAVAVSPDGKRIATGDQMGTIRVWELDDVLPLT